MSSKQSVQSSRADLEHGQHDDSDIAWDDSLLTNVYDEQLKLIGVKVFGGSLSEPAANPNSNETKSSSPASKQKIQLKKDKENSAQSQDKKPTFSNKSRKFRYEAGEGKEPDASQQPATNCKERTTADNDMPISGGAVTSCIMPPPCDFTKLPPIDTEEEARTSMLMAWYMAGYQTGYYEAMRKFRK